MCVCYVLLLAWITQKITKWQDVESFNHKRFMPKKLVPIKKEKKEIKKFKINFCRINYTHQISDRLHALSLWIMHIFPLSVTSSHETHELSTELLLAYFTFYSNETCIQRQFAFVLDYFHLSFSFSLAGGVLASKANATWKRCMRSKVRIFTSIDIIQWWTCVCCLHSRKMQTISIWYFNL